MTDQQLGSRAVRGIAWTGGGQVLRQIVALGTSVLLARLLSPEDFGVFALTFFAAQVAQMFSDFGVGSAIVQKRDTSEPVLSTCFWLNIFGAVTCAIVLISLGPFLADYFRQPAIAPLTMAIALNLLINGAMVIPQSILMLKMDFPSLAKAQVIGSVIASATAISVAAAGAGVWALAAQPIAGSLTTLILCTKWSGWQVRAVFRYESIRHMVGFSMHLLGFTIIGFLARQVHVVVIGRMLGSAPLGIFNMVSSVTYLPIFQVSAVVVRVLFPTLANLQDDPQRLRTVYLKAVSAIAALTFPMMVGVAAVADDLVAVVFGSAWSNMTPILRIVCWATLVQSVATTAGTVLMSTGNTRAAFHNTVGFLVAMIIAQLIGVQWGLIGAAIAFAIVSIASYFALIISALARISMPIKYFLRAIFGPLAASLVMFASLLPIQAMLADVSPPARLVLTIICGAAIYMLGILLFARHLPTELIRTIRSNT